MSIKTALFTAAAVAAFTVPALAQDDTATQRDINQQNRIESGLQNGQLNTHEASKLERGEARVNRAQARAESNGSVSASEQAHINTLQNKESAAIDTQKHDAQTGNADSASSQRMQSDVQRDANQETRIQAGENNGSLTDHEQARLNANEARDDRSEANAGANGQVNANEQANVQAHENASSAHIHAHKHNG